MFYPYLCFLARGRISYYVFLCLLKRYRLGPDPLSLRVPGWGLHKRQSHLLAEEFDFELTNCFFANVPTDKFANSYLRSLVSIAKG